MIDIDVDRDAIRRAFAELLGPYYIPSGRAVKIYDFYTEKLEGQSPVVVVADSGLDPVDLTPTRYEVGVFLTAMHFVKKGEEGGVYTKSAADAKLSEMTRSLLTAVKSLQEHDLWQAITFNSRSTIGEYKLGGVIYWGEPFELRFVA